MESELASASAGLEEPQPKRLTTSEERNEFEPERSPAPETMAGDQAVEMPAVTDRGETEPEPEPEVAPAASPQEVQLPTAESEPVQGEVEWRKIESATHSTEPEPAKDAQLLKLEARPSSGRAVEQGTETAEVEDWWSAEPEPDHLEQSSERKVLKLKARPLPAEEPDEEAQADVSPEAEDLWTADETVGS
jgi:hypothetical protein